MITFRSSVRRVVQALACLSLTFAPSILSAQSRGPNPSIPNAAGLRSEAAAEGHIRVIVGVGEASLPEGALSSAQRSDQRSRIALAQSRVIERVGQGALVNRFETIPFLTLTVSPEELETLLADPSVNSVTIDVPMPPNLDRSTYIIGARRLWNAGITGTDTSVAVLDTGVSLGHVAFDGAFTAGACFSTTVAGSGITSLCPNGGDQQIGPQAAISCDTSTAGCEHGTHVSGIVMGHAPRAFRGVAPDGQLIPIQVYSRFPLAICQTFDLSTECVLSYTSDQMEALEYVGRIAADHNIVAVNMSLGSGRHSRDCDRLVENRAYAAIVDNLTSMGIAVVASSGNSGLSRAIAFPACLSNVIAVGATNDNDGIARFSNQAPGMVDLMAPGVDIEAALVGTRRGTVSFSGTSMAAPHVAGAFALLRDAVPDATVAEMLAALQCTGTMVSRGANSYPRINVAAARRQLRVGGQPGCS